MSTDPNMVTHDTDDAPQHPAMANFIRAWRESRKMSKAALGRALGTPRQQVEKLEKPERKLDTDWLARLAKALNCEPADLLKPPPPPADMPRPALDIELLRECIEQVEAKLAENRVKVTTRQRARLISQVYERAVENPGASTAQKQAWADNVVQLFKP